MIQSLNIDMLLFPFHFTSIDIKFPLSITQPSIEFEIYRGYIENFVLLRSQFYEKKRLFFERASEQNQMMPKLAL